MEAPKLKPFSTITCCEKCGNGYIPPNPVGLGPQDPAPFILAPVFFSSFTIRYCAGGKEPENPTEQNPVASFLQTVSAIAPDKLASSLPPRINICAGIGEDHLHLTCTCCQYEFLMQTKPEEVFGK